MALRNAPPPDGNKALLARYLVAAMRANRRVPPGEGKPEVTQPHPVYQIKVEDILAGTALQSARLTSWRYFVLRDKKLIGMVSVGVPLDGELFFAGFQQGAGTGGLIETIRASEAFERVKERDDLELRGVQIPDVYVAGLWLHAPRLDLLVPAFAPDEIGLEIRRPYLPQRFFDVLHPEAKEALQPSPDDSI